MKNSRLLQGHPKGDLGVETITLALVICVQKANGRILLSM